MRVDGRAPARHAIEAALRAIGTALQRIPRGWAWLPALAWAGLIWGLSSRSLPPLGAPGTLGRFFSNLAHAPEFGLLAVWLALAAPRRDGWPDLGPAAIATILLAVASYAIVDEVHQSFTPHRDPSAFDVLTDVTGAFATLACIARAAGPRASSPGLRRSLALGLAACCACAALASLVPDLFPGQGWL